MGRRHVDLPRLRLPPAAQPRTVEVPDGRPSGTALRELADLADKYGRAPGGGRIRLTAQQGIVVLDVSPADSETVVDQLQLLGFTVRPSAAPSRSARSHLGGQLGTKAEFGRKFRGLKVTAEQAPDYVERVLRGYLERREGAEAFAAYVSRADEAWLL